MHLKVSSIKYCSFSSGRNGLYSIDQQYRTKRWFCYDTLVLWNGFWGITFITVAPHYGHGASNCTRFDCFYVFMWRTKNYQTPRLLQIAREFSGDLCTLLKMARDRESVSVRWSHNESTTASYRIFRLLNMRLMVNWGVSIIFLLHKSKQEM